MTRKGRAASPLVSAVSRDLGRVRGSAVAQTTPLDPVYPVAGRAALLAALRSAQPSKQRRTTPRPRHGPKRLPDRREPPQTATVRYLPTRGTVGDYAEGSRDFIQQLVLLKILKNFEQKILLPLHQEFDSKEKL